MNTEQVIELVRRASVLGALREEGGMDRRDLERRLGVSKSTVHRFTRSLRESGLVDRSDGAFVLTPLGAVCAAEVTAFRRSVETAWRLEALLRAADAHGVDVDLETFADATVTTAEPGNPYRPVNRFMSLVNETGTLRGLDPASINPLHLDDLHERIVDDMETDAVFPPAVVDELFASNPQRARTALESGNLTLSTHDDLPFGLTLCDDRIGVGVYDETTGLLHTYVDTDDPAAREWAERIYARYRVESREVPALSSTAPVQPSGDDD